MKKSVSFFLSLLLLLLSPLSGVSEPLPVGSNPVALETPHFPNRLHAFVWRNWYLVSPQRLAEVVNTSPEKITDIATSMGLPADPVIPSGMMKQGYITIIRRNWHILPYAQLLTLIGMTEEKLGVTLREDDFLYIKLGSLKPKCEPLQYEEPTAQVRKRAAAIKQLVQRDFGELPNQDAEPRFDFIRQLKETKGEKSATAASTPSKDELRFIYSYFGVFGDPLIDSSLDPYPDGLLEKLSDMGVTGVWMHVVLRQLSPGGAAFPEFGEGHEKRLETLRALVQKAKRYGIGIYLYMNEPRAMPASFFENRPEMRGVPGADHFAMCTSNGTVRQWVEDSLAYVFTEVPDLGGVFTITASENLTNCASKFTRDQCPRCKERTDAEVIAEINTVIEKGVHRGNP
ncbi:MAG: hypothetical protein L3K26_20485, partial [Candidatus Hydrogenedentes bacterium]|nr:hypothetical protein [Candidatus Hydrogenedentota bacterium]